jgi:hypothetical protein
LESALTGNGPEPQALIGGTFDTAIVQVTENKGAERTEGAKVDPQTIPGCIHVTMEFLISRSRSVPHGMCGKLPGDIQRDLSALNTFVAEGGAFPGRLRGVEADDGHAKARSATSPNAPISTWQAAASRALRCISGRNRQRPWPGLFGNR